jgi:hypothetical protein
VQILSACGIIDTPTKDNIMMLHIEWTATFFPFFNKVEANEINPKLDDSLSDQEESQIFIQILKSFQESGYTQVQDCDVVGVIPIKAYIDFFDEQAAA